MEESTNPEDADGVTVAMVQPCEEIRVNLFAAAQQQWSKRWLIAEDKHADSPSSKKVADWKAYIEEVGKSKTSGCMFSGDNISDPKIQNIANPGIQESQQMSCNWIVGTPSTRGGLGAKFCQLENWYEVKICCRLRPGGNKELLLNLGKNLGCRLLHFFSC